MLVTEEKGSKQLNITNTKIESISWKVTIPSNEYYTCDELIEAYIKGRNEGLKQLQKVLYNTLVDNMKKTGEYVFEILEHLHKEKFSSISAYLKIVSWDYFKVLITLPEKEFLSDRFLSIYNYISEFEDNKKEDLYKFEITFIDSDNIEQHNIKSDGFIFKHQKSIT